MIPSLPLDIARSYLLRRWMPLPVPTRSKNPGFKDWQNFRVTEADLSQHFNGKPQNIGVLLGAASGNLVDVDLDCTEAVTLAPYFLPTTGAIFGRETRPRSHWLYVAPIPKKVAFIDAITGKRLIEVLTNGQQSIFPGSEHEGTGELVRWYEGGEPAHVSEETLITTVKRHAAATLLAVHWPREGSRQETALALAGGLLRAGISEADTAHFIKAVCHAAGDEETRSRVNTACYTQRKLEEGASVTGWPTLAKLIDERIVSQVCQWLAISEDSRATVQPTRWGEPEELPDDLLPVPAFDMRLLPGALRAWIADISERMQCPAEFPSIAALIAAASVIGNRVCIRPKRADEWAVVPNLWGAIVGRPGVLKSPALEDALKPLKARERVAREEYQQAMQDFDFQRMYTDAQREQLKKEIQKAVKEKRDGTEYKSRLADLQANTPVERRYIVNDPTVEKFGELLNQNPRGLLLFRDELMGWLKSLERDGREQDRSFYLETWTGSGDYTYDRIGRGTLRVNNLTVSILGGIQPGMLMRYLHSAINGGSGDDGLIQRFQLLVYPDVPREWRNVDRVPDGEATARAHQCFGGLDTLEPEAVGAMRDDKGVAYLRFDDEAQEFFDGWRADLETSLLGFKFEHPALQAHMSKYRSLLPSLALIFHLTDRVNGATTQAGVSLDAARGAASWCALLEEHARRIYGLALSSEITLARSLIKHMRRGDLPSEFTARDVYRKQWTGLCKPSDVSEPLRILEDYGWLQSYSVSRDEKGGRSSICYVAHPSLCGAKAV